MSKTNYPQNDDNTIYIDSETNPSLQEILDAAREKWPDIDFKDLNINSEYIHTRCIGYDLYDSNDYDNYIVITKINKAMNDLRKSLTKQKINN